MPSPGCAAANWLAILLWDVQNKRPVPYATQMEAPRHRLEPLRGVLALLALSVFINYIDRGSLSIAAPILKDELHLSASQLGILLSSFFWTYACFQIVSGWLVDRFNVNWVLAIGFFVWSSATAVTGLVHGFAILLMVRLVLGIGESVAYPSCSKILARHFSEDQRGFANSVIAAGNLCGPGFGMFVGGVLMARYGWRSFFVVLGLVSLIWLVLWWRWMPRTAIADVPDLSQAPGILAILEQRSAWGTCAGLFSVNYLSYFLITWLPFYLVRERHFSMNKMANVAGGSYLAAALVSAFCGWLSDRWIEAGMSPTRVRKTFTGAGLGCAAVFLLICVVAGPRLSIVTLALATMSLGACFSNLWAITQTLAGPEAAGRWTGVQNFAGNLAGWFAPALTGFVLDRTGQFFWPFAITAAVALLGTLAWVFMVGPLQPVVWDLAGPRQNPA
jgi:MFS transporter, ACS family, D-galactonate transporter